MRFSDCTWLKMGHSRHAIFLMISQNLNLLMRNDFVPSPGIYGLVIICVSASGLAKNVADIRPISRNSLYCITFCSVKYNFLLQNNCLLLNLRLQPAFSGILEARHDKEAKRRFSTKGKERRAICEEKGIEIKRGRNEREVD